MSDPTDSSPNRKRRVIHWDPDHGRASGAKRWTVLRIASWVLGGGLALLIAAGLVIRGIRLVVGPQFLRPAMVAQNGVEADPSLAFVSESKATLARENVEKALGEMRRLPQDHPSQLQQLILIEKAFLDGDELLAAGKYSLAYAHFTALGRELDAYGENVKLNRARRKPTTRCSRACANSTGPARSPPRSSKRPSPPPAPAASSSWTAALPPPRNSSTMPLPRSIAPKRP
jgi:hypothetical protein